jgi:hypothetical protein
VGQIKPPNWARTEYRNQGQSSRSGKPRRQLGEKSGQGSTVGLGTPELVEPQFHQSRELLVLVADLLG